MLPLLLRLVLQTGRNSHKQLLRLLQPLQVQLAALTEAAALLALTLSTLVTDM
jgi:hypothetical protein